MSLPDDACTGLTARADDHGLEIVAATHVTANGAVFGLITAAEAQLVVRALMSDLDPGPGAPDSPWAAVVARPDGSYAATASTMLPGGLFWVVADGQFVVGTDPLAVDHQLPGPVTLDDEFLQRYCVSDVPVDRTPFAQVRRTPAGSTLTWSPRDLRPQVRQWCGAEVWSDVPTDDSIGIAEYRDTFVHVIADLVTRTAATVTTVSGGLDSTFVAAALARTAVQPVTGLIHVPLPEAELLAAGPFDPDESSLAALLQDRYPDALAVTKVCNDHGVTPLQAAAERSQRSGYPVYNPANAVWLSQMERISTQAGASMLFTGTNGNAAFSYHHPYARPRPGMARRLRAGLRRRPMASHRPEDIVGAPFVRPPQERSRDAYLHWLGATDSGLTASLNPAGFPGALRVDPFRSRRILDLAARISPVQWRTGELPRGFARRVAEGWVPDPIRLRTRRGGQGWDAWYVSRNDLDAYLVEVERLEATPALADWVDVPRVRRTVQSWPWGRVEGPPRGEFAVITRLLALAAFAAQLSADRPVAAGTEVHARSGEGPSASGVADLRTDASSHGECRV